MVFYDNACGCMANVQRLTVVELGLCEHKTDVTIAKQDLTAALLQLS